MNSDLKILKPGETGYGVMIERDAGHISPEDSRNHGFINEVSKLTKGQPITEEPLILYVVLQKYGVENKNGRVYPKDILEREVKNYQENVDQGNAVGESDHPDSSIVTIDNISHRIIETWWEGKTLMGKLQIFLSPGFLNHGGLYCSGDRIANLLRHGVKIGVSSRGVGSLEEIGGKKLVQNDFELICWDAVISPSTPGSWTGFSHEELKPHMESEEKGKNKGKLNEMSDKLDNFLID